ncbi:MAG: pilus assembly protein PilY [Dechloromonas sp.]|nr:MAG: pilus assembly protein PilY [Dechloromonas sp.]
MFSTQRGSYKSILVILSAALTLVSGMSARAAIDVSQSPLFLPSPVDPNILFVLDDSGSMMWEVTPDDITFVFPRIIGMYGGTTNYTNYVASVRFNSGNANEQATARALRSVVNNATFYNPAVTYRPWAMPDGSSWPDAPPAAAPHHPVRPGLGTRNFTVNNTDRAIWVRRASDWSDYSCVISCTEGNAGNLLTWFPATYARYLGGPRWNGNSYQMVEIKAANAPFSGDGRENRTDAGCAAGSCSYTAEIQNFANWYTYYRSRHLAAAAGVGRAFAVQSDKMRVGFGSINKAASSVDGVVDTEVVISGVRPFSGTDRETFFDNLYEGNWDWWGTPLRWALDNAGQYFERADNRGPWGKIPGTNDASTHLACRQSYTILMTDGYWNGAAAETAGAQADTDSTGGPTILGPSGSFTFDAVTPFRDGRGNTLADVAMYYWKRDLRDTLDNLVPTSTINPAFWQHMVTFGIGFGVAGTVSPTTAFDALANSPAININWPNPTGGTAQVDDLLHAAINSRGGFFSAREPDVFASELSGVLQEIVARSLASNGVSASATRRDTSFLVYVPEFDSADWTGDVKAYNLNADGSLASVAWSVSAKFNSGSPVDHSSRDIYVALPSGSSYALSPFTVSGLGGATSAEAHLGIVASDITAYGTGITVSEVIDYVRGSHANEGTNGGPLRNRLRAFGDIIGSKPEVIRANSFGYETLPAVEGGGSDDSVSGTYAHFLKQKRAKDPVLFVGSNDGMLHAFDATETGGDLLFSVMPNGSLGLVKELPKKTYAHHFGVDGSPAQFDVRLGGSWKTILLTPMGAGGRSVFALDVTDAASSFSMSSFLWEFKNANLGYTLGDPKAAYYRGNQWYVTVPNGAGANDHQARLFFLDPSDGSIEHNVVLGSSGTASDPNGLMAAVPVDSDFDGRADTVYAADLHGNVWKIVMSAAGVPTVAYGGPFYVAKDASGNRQPITGSFSAAVHHLSGQMVFFGTGKYFEVGDNTVSSTPPMETFYGVWDNGASVGGRSQLTQQSITGEIMTTDGLARTMSNVAVDWNNEKGWYVDLAVGSTKIGERFVGQPKVQLGRVFFTTYTPKGDACQPGGENRLYALSALTGAANFGFDDATCTDCGGVVIGSDGGAIDVPDFVVTPPGSGACRPGIDTGCELQYVDEDGNPCTAGDPGCSAVTPGAAQGCRLDIGVVLSNGTRSIGGLSCGVQSWRQLQ